MAAEVTTFKAADGVQVYAEVTPAAGARRGTILLFHMAGSNHGEYAPIARRLADLGFDAVAVDQRSGGPAWGQPNETVKRLGRSTDYEPALADLDAALAFARARNPGQPVLAWGSSYSAALVFVLAARHPAEVSAILAFSPGEYLHMSVRAAAAQVRCPAFVTSASDPGEIAAARTLLAAISAPIKRQFVPTAGVHGSSTLRQDQNPRGAEANWQAVAAFLDDIAPRR